MPRSTYSRRQDSVFTELTTIMRPHITVIGGLIRGSMTMRKAMKTSGWVFTTLLVSSGWIGGASALTQAYCSSQNTGTVEGPYNQFASLGSCHDFCMGDYSLAIVQGYNCWCSNYLPNPTNNQGDCTSFCPGYGLEDCGNPDSGSWGYVVIKGKKPKGTASADDKPSSSTVSEPDETSHLTPPSPRPPPTSTSEKVSSNGPTTTAPTTTAPTTTTSTSYLSVITVTDGVRTVTYTATDGSSRSTNTSAPSNGVDSGNFFSNAGRVAGVFTVIALVIIGAFLFLFFFIRRRRGQHGATQLQSDSPTPDGSMGNSILPVSEKRRSRSLSTLGLVGSTSEKPLPTINTTLGPPKKPGSTAMRGGTSLTPPDRVIDQRLDPAIWVRFENDQASRMSVRSLRDDQDYSRRVLRLANPDED